MRTIHPVIGAALGVLFGCGGERATEPPPEGWANVAPAVVEQSVSRGETQLLAVQESQWRFWVQVPNVGAEVGDHVLLGKGKPRYDVEVPELGTRASQVIDITHVAVVDAETALLAIAGDPPDGAVAVETVFAELGQRKDQPIVVYGTVTKATSAVGSVWVHLQDGTGDPESGTHDLMVQTQAKVTAGQRAGFRGTLRKDADLGFGYQYQALVEEAELIE